MATIKIDYGAIHGYGEPAPQEPKKSKTKLTVLCVALFAAICIVIVYITNSVSYPAESTPTDPMNHAFISDADEQVIDDPEDILNEMEDFEEHDVEWYKFHNDIMKAEKAE